MGLIPWRNKQDVTNRKAQGDMLQGAGQFRSEVNRLFDSFFSDPWSMFADGASGRGTASWFPSLDVIDGKEEVSVELEVPGIEPENIDISLSGNILTIAGEKREERVDNKDHHRSERRFGSFRRVVELPGHADPESIKADYKKGVLRVTAKKMAQPNSRRISISAQ